MRRRAHPRAGTSVLCTVAAVAIAAGCGPRPQARPAAQPAAPPVNEPEYVVDLDRIQRLQALRNDATSAVTLVLPLPALAGNTMFTFTRVERPVPADRLPNVLFARGESQDPPRVARITLTTTNVLRITIFDDTAVYIAQISPNTPFRYRRLAASKDDDGHNCSVPLRENDAAFRRISLLAASAAAPDSVPPRRLQIVMAVGPTMSGEFAGDDTRLETEMGDLLNAANEPLGRDVAVTLVQSGTVLRATSADLPGADRAASVQTFIQNAATTNGWQMDLGHLIEEDGGGRSDIGGFCVAGRSATAWSGSPDAFIEPVFFNFVHEVGHQLGAAHTYNITDTFRDPLNAYEPGKGISLMSIGDDIGPYYHANTMALVDQSLHDRTAASGCGTESMVTTTAPVVRVNDADPHVPRNTPFEVEALPDMASSAYRWDEYDLAAHADLAPPFFDSSAERSRARTYPPLAQLMAAATSVSPSWPIGKVKFRLLGFSGVSHKHQDMTVHIDNVQPFAILSLACPTMPCSPGDSLNVRWRVSGTTARPFNVSTLRVEVVEEAGGRYRRRSLASGLPNTGRATLPIPTTFPSPITVRLMLHAERGIFFALSDRLTIR